MTDLLNLNSNSYQIFLLALCRMAGLFSSMPLFGSQTVPAQLKAGLALLVTMLVFPSLGAQPLALQGGWAMVILCAKESLVGLLIGFAATFVFTAIQAAGEIVTRQMGMDMASMVDPLWDTEMSAVSQLQLMTASIVFLLLNGHHWVIGAAIGSFHTVPLSMPVFNAGLCEQFIRMTSGVFDAAIRISAPVFFTLFLMTFVLGLVERVVPQMHIMAVGFPIKIICGLLLTAFFADVFVTMSGRAFGTMKEDVAAIVHCLKG